METKCTKLYSYPCYVSLPNLSPIDQYTDLQLFLELFSRVVFCEPCLNTPEKVEAGLEVEVEVEVEVVVRVDVEDKVEVDVNVKKDVEIEEELWCKCR